MSYQKDRDEFIGVIVEETWNRTKGNGGSLEDAIALARSILRDAATIQRHAINECNREVTPGEVTRAEDCQRRILEACKPWGIKPNFGGDPRGACVKLILPSGRYNSWGGPEDGYCVPTR